MNKDFNSKKEKKLSEKVDKMKSMIGNNDVCKQLAKKLTNYIKGNN